ncbi:hypothetical protein [Allocoleopsis sp.]
MQHQILAEVKLSLLQASSLESGEGQSKILHPKSNDGFPNLHR